jgi:hypothetical protein
LQVDALYGIGLNRAPEPSAATLIEQINASGVPVLALDVPSGLNADTGHSPGAAVRADVTVTFIAGKRGLHTGRSADLVGCWSWRPGRARQRLCNVKPDAQLLAADSPCRRVPATPTRATTATCW